MDSPKTLQASLRRARDELALPAQWDEWEALTQSLALAGAAASTSGASEVVDELIVVAREHGFNVGLVIGRTLASLVAAGFSRQVVQIVGQLPPLETDLERCLVLTPLGHAQSALGNASAARQAYEECLRIARLTGSSRVLVASLSNLGTWEANHGQLLASKAYFDQAENAIESADEELDPTLVASVLNNQGNTLRRLGDLAGARASYERLASDVRAMADPRVAMNIYGNLANLAAAGGDHAAAVDWFQLSRESAIEAGDVSVEVRSLTGLGGSAAETGAHERAVELLNLAIDLAVRHGLASDEGAARANLATTHWMSGATDLAAAQFRRAIDVLTRAQSPLAIQVTENYDAFRRELTLAAH